MKYLQSCKYTLNPASFAEQDMTIKAKPLKNSDPNQGATIVKIPALKLIDRYLKV